MSSTYVIRGKEHWREHLMGGRRIPQMRGFMFYDETGRRSGEYLIRSGIARFYCDPRPITATPPRILG